MKYVIANWKQHMGLSEVRQWVEDFEVLLKDVDIKNVTVIIAPTFVHLPEVRDLAFKHDFIFASAQDISEFGEGSHTGEVGMDQLSDFCSYCIVGHSERKEAYEIVRDKTLRCLDSGIIPIVCFVNAESSKDYYLPKVLLAWEDPSNISKEGQYNPKDISAVEEGIKLATTGIPNSGDIGVIYGGSVNRDNSSDLVSVEGLDGVLVGNASLDPKHFFDIINVFDGN